MGFGTSCDRHSDHVGRASRRHNNPQPGDLISEFPSGLTYEKIRFLRPPSGLNGLLETVREKRIFLRGGICQRSDARGRRIVIRDGFSELADGQIPLLSVD